MPARLPAAHRAGDRAGAPAAAAAAGAAAAAARGVTLPPLLAPARPLSARPQNCKQLKEFKMEQWGVDPEVLLSDTRVLDVLLHNSDRHHGARQPWACACAAPGCWGLRAAAPAGVGVPGAALHDSGRRHMGRACLPAASCCVRFVHGCSVLDVPPATPCLPALCPPLACRPLPAGTSLGGGHARRRPLRGQPAAGAD